MRKIHINKDDNWATPPEFYKKLDTIHHFDFDPCPYSEESITDAKNGLLIEWGGVNFVNPPYSRTLKTEFVLKALEEKKKGRKSVFLLPVSTGMVLFKDIIEPNISAPIEFIRGRIKFGKLDRNGKFYLPLNKKGKISSGTKDSMIIIF